MIQETFEEDTMKRKHGPITHNCIITTLPYVRAQYCQTHSAYVKRCPECGQLFHTVRPHTITCSARCRKRASRREHSERSER